MATQKKTAKSNPKSPAKRRLKTPKYKSFRLQKRIKSTAAQLPSSWQLWKEAWNTIKTHKRFFAVYAVIYGALTYVFVTSSSTRLNVVELKDTLSQGGSAVGNNLAVFTALLGTGTGEGGSSGLYQAILVIIFSLAIIFGLRHMYSDDKKLQNISAKQALYTGMTPLIPFVLVLLVIGVQLLPFSIGSSVYTSIMNNGLAVTGVEKVFWSLLLALLGLLSAYLVTSSFFALYIVTLPNMTPVKALRTARGLVRHRRLHILRKLLLFILAVIVILGFIIIPIIALLPSVAATVYFVATIALLPVAHCYAYAVYRKML